MTAFSSRLVSAVGNPARVRTNEPLARHTTFRVGGPAQYFVAIHTLDELQSVLLLAREHGIQWHIIGNGSNLIVADEGVRGLVLTLQGEFSRWSLSGTEVRAGAGLLLPTLAVQMARRGLTGLNFAAGVPGTVGAGVAINAGAHGGDMSKVVRKIQILWPDGRLEWVDHKDADLTYRGSRIQREGAIVTEARFQTAAADTPAVESELAAFLARRRETQPLNRPSAGSFFKNPPGDHAGRLIEAAGCKGWSFGGAQVSERHANFIINQGQATASAIVVLRKRVQDAVAERFGVELQPEVRFWE